MGHVARWLALIVGCLAAFAAWPAAAADDRLRLIGQLTYPTAVSFDGTTVGGLSGLTYDSRRNVYYAISDDRSDRQPARFYTLEIELGPDGIADVRVVGVTTLDSDADAPGIQPYARNSLDPEEIVLLPNDDLLISSERDARGRPWIRRFALDGSLLAELPIPDRFLTETETSADGKPVVVRGVRNNLAFEGVALAPDGKSFYAINEEALAQDGPIATPQAGTVVRILRYEPTAEGWRSGAEVAYRVEKISATPAKPGDFADNGVSGLLWSGQLWPDVDLIVMERSFVSGFGNDVVLFGVQLAGADPTERLEALPVPFEGRSVRKTLLARIKDLGVNPDNLEGITLGPTLSNGKQSLILMSDDNFNAEVEPQVNQFLLFEVNEAAPASQAATPIERPSVQMPAALPRTGTLSIGLPLIAAGVLLFGLGWTLRVVGRGWRR